MGNLPFPLASPVRASSLALIDAIAVGVAKAWLLLLAASFGLEYNLERGVILPMERELFERVLIWRETDIANC